MTSDDPLVGLVEELRGLRPRAVSEATRRRVAARVRSRRVGRRVALGGVAAAAAVLVLGMVVGSSLERVDPEPVVVRATGIEPASTPLPPECECRVRFVASRPAGDHSTRLLAPGDVVGERRQTQTQTRASATSAADSRNAWSRGPRRVGVRDNRQSPGKRLVSG